jgi:leucyl aminopeptidase
MKINQLRDQLADLKKKEAVAQSREQLLDEEKQKLLGDIDNLYRMVRELGIVPPEALTPSNLSNVATLLQQHIEKELTSSNLPKELL